MYSIFSDILTVSSDIASFIIWKNCVKIAGNFLALQRNSCTFEGFPSAELFAYGNSLVHKNNDINK